jgi:hypothetical protein
MCMIHGKPGLESPSQAYPKRLEGYRTEYISSSLPLVALMALS